MCEQFGLSAGYVVYGAVDETVQCFGLLGVRAEQDYFTGAEATKDRRRMVQNRMCPAARAPAGSLPCIPPVIMTVGPATSLSIT